MLTHRVSSYLHDLRAHAARVPVELFAIASTAAALSYAVEVNHRDHWETAVALLLALFTTLPFVLLLSVLATRDRLRPDTRFFASGLALAVAVFSTKTFFDIDLASHFWRWGGVTVGAWGAFLLTPVIAGERFDAHRIHWRFFTEVLRRAVEATVAAAILTIGVSFAIGAIHELFDVPFGEELIQHVTIWLGFATAGTLFVTGLPRFAAFPRDIPGPDNRTFSGSQAIGLPLIALYLGIIYVYSARVVVTGEMPRNLLSPLALTSGFAVLACVCLWDPIQNPRDGRFVTRIVRWLPALILPTVPVALVAVQARIEQYGVTEFRYIRALLLVDLCVLGALGLRSLAGRKHYPIAAVPLVIAGSLLVTAIGPFSAASVALNSQKARAVALIELRDGGVVTEGRLPSRLAEPSEGDVQLELSASLFYLCEHFGPQVVEDVTGEETRDCYGRAIYPDRVAETVEQAPFQVAARPRDQVRLIDVQGTAVADFDVAWYEHTATRSFDDPSLTLELNGDLQQISGQFGGEEFVVSLTSLAHELVASCMDCRSWGYSEIRLDEDHMTYPVFGFSGRNLGTIILRSATVEHPASRPGQVRTTSARITNLTGTIILR